MSPEKQGEVWAKEFNKLSLIDQIVSLYRLQDDNNNIEVKFQIVSLLGVKIVEFLEHIQREEDKIKKQISTKENVEALTCGAVHPTLGVKCGLPASHITKAPISNHQNVNVHW